MHLLKLPEKLLPCSLMLIIAICTWGSADQSNTRSSSEISEQYELSSNLKTTDFLPLSKIRKMSLGSIVSATGIVSAGACFSGPVFFEDSTAGMAFFQESLMRNSGRGFTLPVNPGDSIIVTGPLTRFNGLLQIAPIAGVMDSIQVRIIPMGGRIINPETITLQELSSGKYESRLIRIKEVSFQNGNILDAEMNYTLLDRSGAGELRVSRFTDLSGTAIPSQPLTVTGIASVFRQTIQVLPRSRNDLKISGHAPLIISSPPYETSATSRSVTIQWKISADGFTGLCYEKTAQNGRQCMSSTTSGRWHQIIVGNLEPATIYRIHLWTAVKTDTVFFSPTLVSTASPESSSGQITVYFNQVSDKLTDPSSAAQTGVRFDKLYRNRIDQAKHSVDVSFYSISGHAGELITESLIRAHQRGVQVRVILDHTTRTYVTETYLREHGIPFILGNAGNLNRGRSGIQHNKFLIVDFKDGPADRVWLLTGSWNATDPGTHEHHQNMIEFQDAAIAGAYTREFEQMWGSMSPHPDPDRARFGEQKVVVSPSVFWIGQRKIKVYFSPQHDVEQILLQTIAGSGKNISLATMLITRFTLAEALRIRHEKGIQVRGLIGLPNILGSQFNRLSSWGDFIAFKQSEWGLLHHKYALFDIKMEDNPHTIVVTGSYNWSSSARNLNDENTLLIRDWKIAGEFLQDFSARYLQAGGNQMLELDSGYPFRKPPAAILLQHNYPNPFIQTTSIAFELPETQTLTIAVYDVAGRKVSELAASRIFSAGTHELLWDGSGLPAGMYIYRVKSSCGANISGTMLMVN